MLMQSILLALRSIARNKLRSLLTLLGVIIGVAAVIALLTIGSGAREHISAGMANMGSRLIFVFAGERPDPSAPLIKEAKPLTNAHLNGLEKAIGSQAIVAAVASTSMRVSHGARSVSAQITGASENHFLQREWKLGRGRLFSPVEAESSASVCVIGSQVSETLFGKESALSARIRIGPTHCRVVGELSARGSSFAGQQDMQVYVPLGLFQTRLSGKSEVNEILIDAPNQAAIEPLKAQITQEMRNLRRIGPGRNDDFQVDDMAEYIQQANAFVGGITAFLSAIAAISLLVGGIGIMNIMLVSVTERTREIGIRMAIGARQRDILVQFLTEAAVLSLLGGLIGIALGLAIAWGVTTLMEVSFAPGLGDVAAITAISIAIGVVFGFFPALRGARLDPIEALRHE